MGYARRMIIRKMIDSNPEGLIRPKKPYQLSYGETIRLLLGDAFQAMPPATPAQESGEGSADNKNISQ